MNQPLTAGDRPEARRVNGARHPRLSVHDWTAPDELEQHQDDVPLDTSDGTGALFVDVGLLVAGTLGVSALLIWALQGFPS